MNIPTFLELDVILESFEKNNSGKSGDCLNACQYVKLAEEDYFVPSMIHISFFDAKQVCNIIDSKESYENGIIIPFYGDSLYHIYFLYFSVKGPRLFRIKNNGSDIKLCTSGFGLSIDP
jgi:hypothetical protein